MSIVQTTADVLNNCFPTTLQRGCPVANDNQFKQAIVTPLLKKPGLNTNDMKNFRPVSNLSFISKILEKVVLIQLKKHLSGNNLLEIFQSTYTYRQNHSTDCRTECP